jgi:hypothetical protein
MDAEKWIFRFFSSSLLQTPFITIQPVLMTHLGPYKLRAIRPVSTIICHRLYFGNSKGPEGSAEITKGRGAGNQDL